MTTTITKFRGGADDTATGVGGDSSGSSKLSVSQGSNLPQGMEGASLKAFRASIPVPTANDDGDNSTGTDMTMDDDTTTLTAAATTTTTTIEDAEPKAVVKDNAAAASAHNKKLANLKERTLPAVLMLGGLGLITYVFKEDGLMVLTLGLQAGMYQEMTSVIGGAFPYQFYKWWWFVTASIVFNGPRLFPWASTSLSALTYGMTVVGIIAAIVGFNWSNAQVDAFREFLRQAAISVLALLLVVAPSSYWISTLEEFGMKWVLLPVLLVIINDTMAYFFGITMGKHPLLPSISPKKTWEGFLGAGLSTIAVSLLGLFPSQQDALVVSIVVSLIGPFGGFLASVIKRAYNQKDFGALFPGHGGFVDRLDCQLFLAPFVFLYLSLTRDSSSADDLLSSM